MLSMYMFHLVFTHNLTVHYISFSQEITKVESGNPGVMESASGSDSGGIDFIDIHKYIPTYSGTISLLLANNDIIKEFSKFIEETAYHVLSLGEFKSKDLYSELGRLLYQKYPCIGFSTGSQPWVITFHSMILK